MMFWFIACKGVKGVISLFSKIYIFICKKGVKDKPYKRSIQAFLFSYLYKGKTKDTVSSL
jgi:hypothetical protein